MISAKAALSGNLSNGRTSDRGLTARTLLFGSEFGKQPSDYSFCGNGIVAANRQSMSKLLEVKALDQPVALLPDERSLRIRNSNLFVLLKAFHLDYRLLLDRRQIAKGPDSSIHCACRGDAYLWLDILARVSGGGIVRANAPRTNASTAPLGSSSLP